MNVQTLFLRSRLKLALWYGAATTVIFSLLAFAASQALIQANWMAMERELESIAGTLHDSLEPLLPDSRQPAVALRRILPELCLAGQSCQNQPTLIERHTTGVSDRSAYYIRLFDRHGRLLAFTPSQPSGLSDAFLNAPWQTISSADGTRYRQFTTILHSHQNKGSWRSQTGADSWGYLQLGRNLDAFDGEVQRIRRILGVSLALSLGLVFLSSFWLSALAMEPIYASYNQQRQFTANAAHELRSPLATLLATVEAIVRTPESQSEELGTMLQTLERQGKRLSRLITDLLFLSRLEQATKVTDFQPCCLNDLIEDLTEEFLELALQEGIALESRLPPTALYVAGDESQLYRLVANLIANAIQHTPPGGRIWVGLTLKDGKTLITVQDTGVGIPPSEQKKIFERFYRSDGARSRKTGGAGLGLALAQAIAQNHGGALGVTSQLGAGSVFTVSLPSGGKTRASSRFPIPEKTSDARK